MITISHAVQTRLKAHQQHLMHQCSQITDNEQSNDQPHEAWKLVLTIVGYYTASVLQLSGLVHTGDKIDCLRSILSTRQYILQHFNVQESQTARQWNSTTVMFTVEPTVTVSTVISIPNREPVRCLVTSFLWILKSFLASDVRKLSLCLLFSNVKKWKVNQKSKPNALRIISSNSYRFLADHPFSHVNDDVTCPWKVNA